MAVQALRQVADHARALADFDVGVIRDLHPVEQVARLQQRFVRLLAMKRRSILACDEPRHMAFGVAVLKAMLADDPANVVVLQHWQDEFAPLIRNFVHASRPIERIPGSDFSADAMWASIVDHHTRNAEKYGLRPTLTLDMV